MEWNKLQILLVFLHILFVISFIRIVYLILIPNITNKINSDFDPKLAQLVKVSFDYDILAKGQKYSDIKISISQFTLATKTSHDVNLHKYRDDILSKNINITDTFIYKDESIDKTAFIYLKKSFFYKTYRKKLNSNYQINNDEMDKEKLTNQEVLNKLKTIELENCFFFDESGVNYGSRLLHKLQKKFSSDIWHFLLYMLVIIFMLSMMISINYQFCTYYISSISNDSKPFFSFFFQYVYHIYTTSLVFILPSLFNYSYTYTFDNCLGFNTNSKYMVLFDRIFTRDYKKSEIDILLHNDTIADSESKFPIKLMSSISDLTDIGLNYVYTVLFLCFILWVSSAMRIFKTENNPKLPFIIFSLIGWLTTLILSFPIYINFFISTISIVAYNLYYILNPIILYTFINHALYIICDLIIFIISCINLKKEYNLNFKLKVLNQDFNSLYAHDDISNSFEDNKDASENDSLDNTKIRLSLNKLNPEYSNVEFFYRASSVTDNEFKVKNKNENNKSENKPFSKEIRKSKLNSQQIYQKDGRLSSYSSENITLSINNSNNNNKEEINNK